MVVFTVLSRAADSVSMARVTVSFPEKHTIDHSVTGSGKVRQNREEAVSVLPNQVVKTIYISEGDEVKEGELLFEIDLPELREQITRKKQELEKLNLQLLDTESQAEANETKKALQESHAKEDLDLAAQRGSLTVNAAAQDLAAAQKALDDYRRSQGKDVEIVHDPVRDQLVQACKTKETAYQKALSDLESIQRERDLKMTEAYLNAQRGNPIPDPPQPAEPDLSAPKPPQTTEPNVPGTEPSQPEEPDVSSTEPSQITEPDIPVTEPSQATEPDISATEPSQAIEPDIPSTEPSLATEPGIPATEPSQATEPGGPSTEPPQATESDLSDSESTLIAQPDVPITESYRSTEPSQSSEPDVPITECSKAAALPLNGSSKARLIPVKCLYTASKNPVIVIDPQGASQSDSLSGSDSLGEFTEDLSNLTPAERRVYDAYAPKITKARQAAEKAKNEKNKADEALSSYDSQKLASDSASSDQLEQQLRDDIRIKQQAYDNALLSNAEGVSSASHSLANASAPDGSDHSGRINELEQELLQLELDKLEDLLKKEGKITSPVNGIVTEVTVTTGNKTSDGMAVLLADLSAGCKFVAQIPRDQEKYVSRNDPVILTPVNGKPLEGFTVDSVADGEEDNVLNLTVSLPSDTALELGQSVDFKIVKTAGPFSSCVPISALHEDNKEKYVFVAEENESVLGKETFARKVPVMVQDRNSLYAALNDSDLSGSQKVITGTSKTINDGGRVRVEE